MNEHRSAALALPLEQNTQFPPAAWFIVLRRKHTYLQCTAAVQYQLTQEWFHPIWHFSVMLLVFFNLKPIPVAVRFKTKVSGRSFAVIAGSNAAWGMMSVSYEFCQADVSASGWSLAQRSPIGCGVWMWSWSRDNEEAMTQQGLLRLGGGGVT